MIHAPAPDRPAGAHECTVVPMFRGIRGGHRDPPQPPIPRNHPKPAGNAPATARYSSSGALSGKMMSVNPNLDRSRIRIG